MHVSGVLKCNPDVDDDNTNIEIWYCNYCQIIATKGNVKWLIDKNKILYRGC